MNKGLKNKGFLVVLLIAIVVPAVITGIFMSIAPKRKNISLKETIKEVADPIAADCGLENLEVVYADNGFNPKIVIACEKMTELSYEEIEKFFDEFLEKLYMEKLEFDDLEKENISVYSGGNRYTAKGDFYETIYENGIEVYQGSDD